MLSSLPLQSPLLAAMGGAGWESVLCDQVSTLRVVAGSDRFFHGLGEDDYRIAADDGGLGPVESPICTCDGETAYAEGVGCFEALVDVLEFDYGLTSLKGCGFDLEVVGGGDVGAGG